MKKIVIIDGQGGKIGTQLIAALRKGNTAVNIIAIGTNSIATASMLKSSPDAAATGENPVIVACRDADVITGPIGIVVADSLYGEVTPKMARAVGQSRALRVLIPVNRCDNIVVGSADLVLSELIREAADKIMSAIS